MDSVGIHLKPGASVSVILASEGYPGSYAKGRTITLPQTPPNVAIFHAGTDTKDGNIVTSGGRVLAVTAYGDTIKAALHSAYQTVDAVQFEGKTFRRDIAHRSVFPTRNVDLLSRINFRAIKEPPKSQNGLTYAQAGVSVDAGNALVEAIKPFVKNTRRPGADGTIGGFGGIFDLKAAGYGEDALLVAGTDGVGTKLRIALESGKHDSVG